MGLLCGGALVVPLLSVVCVEEWAWLGVVCVHARVCVLSWCLTLCKPLDEPASQSRLSMGFPRQEYWSGLPFPTLGVLPDPGIKAASLASPTLSGRFITTTLVLPGKPSWEDPVISYLIEGLYLLWVLDALGNSRRNQCWILLWAGCWLGSGPWFPAWLERESGHIL